MSKKSISTTLAALFCLFLANNLSTNDTYAEASLTVSGDAVINLTSLSAEGSFAKSGNISISASTDSPSGYKLMIQANNSTSLVSGNNEITSLDAGTSITEEAFRTGNYNGKWGYLPSMLNSVNNTTFRPSPSTTGDVINSTACANGTTSCPNITDNYTIAIGAKVNSSQPIGNYSNTFNIMMVSNGIEYSITYRDTKVSNMPEDITGETSASTVILSSSMPTREGYNFLGWCTIQPAADGSCSGTSYAAGGTYTLTGSTNDLTLYARWGTGSGTIATTTYMQDVTSCPSTLTTGQQYTLTDKRDGKTYTVAKQADGKCWMTQNLDLDIGGSNTAPLTSENTNLNASGSGAYALGYKTVNGVIVWDPIDTAITSDRTISGTTITGNWKEDKARPYSVEGGDVYAYTSGSDSDDTIYNSLSACKAAHTEAECKHYHVGNFYNWSAAVASNDTTSFVTTFDIASNDICPKGWRLPIGAATSSAQSSTREFGQLWFNSGITTGVDTETYATNGFNKIRTAPLFFVRAGYVYGGDSLFKEAVFSGFGGGGDYWSSALIGRGSSGFSHFSKTQVINDSGTMNTYGYSLRCVVR